MPSEQSATVSARLKTVDNALLVPVHKRFKSPRRTRACGVFDSENTPVPEATFATQRWSAHAPPELGEQARENAVPLPGTWLFGGLLRPHFGHILTNALGRLWAADITENIDGIVFIGDKAKSTQSALFSEIAAAFGEPLPHHICKRTTAVERLVVGADLFSEANNCLPASDFVDWIRNALPTHGRATDSLYVTRSKLDPLLGRVLNEGVIEKNFRANGYTIYAPEEHQIADQIAAYQMASRIVTTDSSALHLIALAARPTTRVCTLMRREEVPPLIENQFSGFATDVTFVNAIRNLWWRPERADNRALAELDFDTLRDKLLIADFIGRNAVWSSPDADAIQASLRLGVSKDTRFLTSDEHRAFVEDTRRKRKTGGNMAEVQEPSAIPTITGLRYLRMLGRMHAVLKPRWYLEIGTFTGKSLSKVNCNFVAVDPKFQLGAPISAPGAAQMHLFQKTSDTFFSSQFSEKNDLTYDFAFLDGLHHFEVLLRDFINTERLMNPNGTIALHDCCPFTEEMTSRTQGPGNWTGDVWKTLLILLKNRPDLDISVARAEPTGLVVIRGLDPRNTALSESYDALVDEYMDLQIADLDGGLAGYYQHFDLKEPEDVLAKLAS